MPYYIQNRPIGCDGWATIKEDGEIIGCHANKDAAIAQMVAVSLAEDMQPGGERDAVETRQVDLSPPEYMRDAARRGLELYADGEAGDGLQDATVREARAMAAGEVSADKWRRIGPWIARHIDDLDAVTADTPITPGLVAHLLWGSGPTKSDALRAQRYAEAVVEAMDKEAEQQNRSLEETDYAWSPRQKALYDELEDIVEIFGKFGQGVDSEGAHYVEQSPFANEGMICANCAFYEGPLACELVEGRIDPSAICKFWIIPNELVGQPVDAPTMRVKERDKGEEIRATLPEVETRQNHQEFELRQLPNGKTRFTGYAAVFNSDSEPLPFIERIMPGAFDKTLRSRNNVKMYLNHDSTLVLASTRAKTLKLSTDQKGLYTETELPDTSYARDLAVMMERGDVDSMSFGFSVPRNGDRWSEDGAVRELREVRLHEVSVVTGFPAYRATSATLRSIDLLAEKTGADANKLAHALTLLENGKELADDDAALLSEAVTKLRATPAETPASVSVALKHLELLKHQF